VTGPRLAPVPLIAVLCGGLGLALAGCGPSSQSAAAPATVTVTATATVTVSAPAATSSAAASAAGENPACPSAAAVSKAAGTAYLPPTANTAAGTLNCSYQASSGLLLISFEQATLPVSDLKQVADDHGPAHGGVKLSPVHGIGDAAYLLTVKPSGQAAALELVAQSGSRVITILGAGKIGQLKAIARMAIAS
jgi:hypothetical protein